MGFLDNLENAWDEDYEFKSKLSDLTMHKTYLDENIFYIENFISEEDIKVILSEIDNAQIQEHEAVSVIPVWPSPTFKPIWENIKNNLKDLFYLDGEYIKEIEDTPDAPAFARYRQSGLPDHFGQWSMTPHQDDVYSEDSKTITTKGFIIYITDSYTGGEVEYIEKGITFKPKSGTLLCHPGTKEYTHAVRKFEGGERIVLSAFVHKNI